MLDAQYQQSIEEIDKHFELRKKELMIQNRQEIEKEREKWEQFKLQEEKKIRSQAESEAHTPSMTRSSKTQWAPVT